MINSLIISLVCAVVACGYCICLVEPDMVLFKPFTLTREHVNRLFYGKKWIEHEDVWLFKMIWGCERCFCGQLCLWSYLIASLRSGAYSHDWLTALSLHVFTICTGIILVSLITKAYRWARN